MQISIYYTDKCRKNDTQLIYKNYETSQFPQDISAQGVSFAFLSCSSPPKEKV